MIQPHPSTSPSTTADSSHVWDHDARVLAGRLRASRLTVLLSPAGVDTTPMLLHGVMPKLHRRVSDRSPSEVKPAGTVIAFPDRRDIEAGLLARRDREIAVFFDVWNDEPVAALLRQVQQAIDAPWMPPIAADATLAGVLAELQSRHNLRFLLLLDRFEDALMHRSASAPVGEFIEQWLEALERPELAAHFLVALPQAELGRFEGVMERIPHFDDQILTANGSGRLFGLSSVASSSVASVPADVLQAVAAVVTPTAAPAASVATAPAKSTVPIADPPSSLPMKSQDDDLFLASLSDLGERIAAAVNTEPRLAEPSQAAEIAATPVDSTVSPDPIPPPSASEDRPIPSDLSGSPEIPATHAEAPAFARAPRVAWLLLPLIVVAGWWWMNRDTPTLVDPAVVATRPPAPVVEAPGASSPSIAVPTPAVPPADSLLGSAALDIAVDPSNATDARVARELTASLAPTGGIELPALPSRGGLATLVDLDAASTSPRLAIANYDALQAARTLPLRPRLSIVMPLYRQEIYFIVRADSPLHALHDLRGARIDAGPADGSRSLTAAAVYRQLFGEPLPAAASTEHDEDASLAELLAFRTVDVVATVGGQPLPWLAALPPATRQRLRLLRLDADDAIDRRALQTFLPSTVRDPTFGGNDKADTPSLSVMSFLVTNAQPGDAAASARLTAFAKGLCDALPALRQAGHPKWGEVRPGSILPTGFADSAAAQAGFAECAESARAIAPEPTPSTSR